MRIDIIQDIFTLFRCQILNSLLVCAANHHIYTIDIAADPFEMQSTSVDDNIQGLEVLHIDDHIGVRVDEGRLVIYRTTRSAAPIEIMRIDKVVAFICIHIIVVCFSGMLLVDRLQSIVIHCYR